MLTDIGEPILLEVNSSPATGTSTDIDVQVKFELLSDVMHCAGVNCNTRHVAVYGTESCDATESEQ